jgi:hypothetical protein
VSRRGFLRRVFALLAGAPPVAALLLLDGLNAAESDRWTLVDAAWTSESPTVAHREAGKLA